MRDATLKAAYDHSEPVLPSTVDAKWLEPSWPQRDDLYLLFGSLWSISSSAGNWCLEDPRREEARQESDCESTGDSKGGCRGQASSRWGEGDVDSGESDHEILGQGAEHQRGQFNCTRCESQRECWNKRKQVNLIVECDEVDRPRIRPPTSLRWARSGL